MLFGGRPGVHTARYGGDHPKQEDAIRTLLEELKEVEEEKRTAKFVCVLTAILQNGKIMTAKGMTKGKIANQCGTMGKLTFGPIFIPDGFDRCMNDLSAEEIGHTHRQKAWKALLEEMKHEN